MINILFHGSTKINYKVLSLEQLKSTSVRVASIDILKAEKDSFRLPLRKKRVLQNLYFIRSRSTDGVVGISVAHEMIKYFFPILQQLVIPYFIGQDLKEIDKLIDGVYRFRANYKISGLALWCCVAWVEFSLLDLLGKYHRKSIVELFGGTPQEKVPIYLSSMRRDTTPEQEIDLMESRLAETGASAVKFKIGGSMRLSTNTDVTPGRTEKLVRQARKVLGDEISIGVDANSTFDYEGALKVGKFLEAFDISFFEEPCFFDDFSATQKLTKSLQIPIAGGENETSFIRFKEIINRGVVNLLQPDLVYNGGFIRTLRVAQYAAKNEMPFTIHNSRLGFSPVYMAQFSCFLPGVFQEFNAQTYKAPAWFSPSLDLKDGKLSIPQGPGFGVEIDPVLLRSARKLQTT
jgi:L-alanine-DL-glutamate epimerase-like enolase superfamily enzyme